MASDKLRIGILGAGIRGSLFAESLSQHPRVEVVGIADLDAALAGSTAKRFKVAAFESLESLLNVDFEALIIATPDFAHRDAAVAAARAGKHLMIEKPLATTVEDAQAIVQAVTESGVTAMVGFENRWNPRFIAAKAAIAAGAGDIQSQTAHLHDTRWVPTAMLSWAARSSPAWFLMPHTLDLMLWLSGKSVESVFAQGAKQLLPALGVDTWDTVDAFLRFTDGTTATLHSSWILPESFPAVYDLRYEAIGSTRALRVNGSDQGVSLYGDRLTWPQWGTYYDAAGKLCGFPVDMAYAFADHLLGKGGDVPTIDDGFRVTRILAAVQTSLETNQPVIL